MEDKPMFGAGSTPTKHAMHSTGFLRPKDPGPKRLPKVIPPLETIPKALPAQGSSAADRKPNPLYQTVAPGMATPAPPVAPASVPQPASPQPVQAQTMAPAQAGQMAQPVTGAMQMPPAAQPVAPQPAVPAPSGVQMPAQAASCPPAPPQIPVQPQVAVPPQPVAQTGQPQTVPAQPAPTQPVAPAHQPPSPQPVANPGVAPPVAPTPPPIMPPADQVAQQPLTAQTVANPAAMIPQQIAPLQPNGSIDDRLYQRKRTLKGGMIVLPGQMMSSYACRIRNESMGGVCLVLSAALEMPSEFYLMRDGDPGHKIPCRVAWRGPDRVGVQFIHQLTCDIPVIG